MRTVRSEGNQAGLASIATALALMFTLEAGSANAAERRCGWLENPTPANFTLRDREREWIISEQGGFQAKGDMPDMTTAGWVETNRSYGYGCACLSVIVDRERSRITDVLSAKPLPLSRCRADHRLPRP